MIDASIIKLVLGIAVTEVQNGCGGRGKVYSYNYKYNQINHPHNPSDTLVTGMVSGRVKISKIVSSFGKETGSSRR